MVTYTGVYIVYVLYYDGSKVSGNIFTKSLVGRFIKCIQTNEACITHEIPNVSRFQKATLDN